MKLLSVLSGFAPGEFFPLAARFGPGFILAIAALTRFWRLDYHSIWFDEAVSLQWANSNPVWTWQKTFTLLEDKHPPLYYISLHYWLELLDLLGLKYSDTAVRAFGSLIGVLTVWGLLLLVRRLSGQTTALLAALLAALCPVLVWYSQEVRMFQPATTAIVWAAYCLVRAWETDQTQRRVGWWLGMALALAFALYSYLFSAFVLPAVGLALLALWYEPPIRRHPSHNRRLLEGVIALTTVALLFLPLAYSAWIVNSAEGAPGRAFAGIGQNVWRLLRVFTIWRVDWPLLFYAAVLSSSGILAVFGLLLPRPQPAPSVLKLDRLWLACWIGTPLLIGNLLLARSDSVFAEDRYFLFLAPFVLWAIARGCVTLDRYVGGAGLTAGLLATAVLAAALPHLWTPAMHREHWRAAAAYVAGYQQASPALPAAVVAHIDYTRRPLERYLRPLLQANEIALYFPFGGALSTEQVETEIAPKLQGIVDLGFATLWLTQSHLEGMDDGRLVEAWLNQHFPLVTEQYPTGVKLSGYALQSRFETLPPLLEGRVYTDAELAPGLHLAACEIINPVLAAQEDTLHPPSGWIHVRLWWQATGPIEDDFIAIVQMVGPEGVWGDRLYRDNEALRRWPTSAWQPGDVVRDEVDVNLNPATPAGEYPLLVGVMNSAGKPLDSRVECGRVRVVA